ncbi:MAG: AarF/UbiB family protein [Acidobacteriota bacterium]|jgi:ubiquinone biosynthesis protein
MALPGLTRHARRFEEIARILIKYGLAEWMGDALPSAVSSRLASTDGQPLTEVRREERIRLALSELGTTFIKLGQVLSTRPDLVGPELADELSELQAASPADPPDVVRSRIGAELGAPLESRFAELDLDPIASGSIGQVHAARLPGGERVVVKVQHPEIEERIYVDLDILDGLAELAETRSTELRLLAPRAVARQFRRRMLNELDFERERHNLERFRRQFARDDRVTFPAPKAALSTRRLLTMERIEGRSVRESEALRTAGHDLQALAARGAGVVLKMILGRGFYHADPHPGNVFVLDDGRICLLDCATAARLNDATREGVEDLLLAAQARDAERMADAVIRVGRPRPDLDRNALEEDLAVFVDQYASQPIESWDFSGLLGELAAIIRRHRILLPAPVSQLLRVLIVLEGTARHLSPRFSLGELLRPWAQRAIGRRLSPRRMQRQLWRSWRDWQRLFDIAPRELAEMLERIRQGTLDVHLQHRGLDATLNRVIYGLLSAALILASALLLAGAVPPLLGGLSVLGVLGAAGALVLTVRLLWAIRRFGGLGRHEDER